MQTLTSLILAILPFSAALICEVQFSDKKIYKHKCREGLEFCFTANISTELQQHRYLILQFPNDDDNTIRNCAEPDECLEEGYRNITDVHMNMTMWCCKGDNCNADETRTTTPVDNITTTRPTTTTTNPSPNPTAPCLLAIATLLISAWF